MWKKLLATTTILLGASVAIPASVNQVQITALPDNQKFIVPNSRVVGYAEMGGDTVRYAYTDTKSEPYPYEDISMRTEMSYTQTNGLGSYLTTFTDVQFHKVGDTWYDLKFATTTKEAYELQTRPILPFAEAQGTMSTTTVTGTWQAPTGVTSVVAEGWGGGGGGSGGDGGDGGGGGGGAAYARSIITVTPGDTYTVTVGTGGNGGSADNNGTAGNDTWFISTDVLFAEGGDGGLLGGAAPPGNTNIGTTTFNGGSGGTGSVDSGGAGGGGGGGNAAIGANGGASAASGAAGGKGGDSYGGHGGPGGTTTDVNGFPGMIPGGGGGGAGEDVSGGVGARGEVRIYWCVDAAKSCAQFVIAGYSTWTVPTGVTSVDIACWGGGGAGFDGSTSGGGRGGGGGAFASTTQSVAASDTIRIFVGAGGLTTGANGATSTASTTAPALITAAAPGTGGKDATTLGGEGGIASISTGSVTNDGGRGGAGIGTTDNGGGGAGAGGPHGDGNVGADAIATTGGAGGTGSAGNGGTSGIAGNGTTAVLSNGGQGGFSGNGGGGGGGADDGVTGGGLGGDGGMYGAGGGGGENGEGEGATGACIILYAAGEEEPAAPGEEYTIIFSLLHIINLPRSLTVLH